MSENSTKSTMKKGFKAPIIKKLENKETSQEVEMRQKEKKIKKQKLENKETLNEDEKNQKEKIKKQSLASRENLKEDKISLKEKKVKQQKLEKKKTSNEDEVNKKEKKLKETQRQDEQNKQENGQNSVQMDLKHSEDQNNKKQKKDGSLSKTQNHSKPQVSLSDSQYDELFNAVLKGNRSNTSSQNNTPIEEILAIIDGKSNLSTPSRKSKDESGKVVLSTPAQQSKVLSQISPWGSHFSKNPSQSSSLLKELQETQSSLLNSSSVVLSSSSSSSSSSSDSESVHSTHLSPKSLIPQKQPRRNQRKRLQELQAHRNVGVWVYCCRESCQKQRYLHSITDPQDVPEIWYCHMNPDPKYNSCQCEEQLLSPEEEEDMIFNSYTAGSVVWARVPGYPWWPAMVDDDPDLEQYYWLLEDFFTVTHYHVVFFDEGAVTRAWVDLKSISPFARHENKYKQKSCRGIDFSKRIQIAKEQANDALTMASYKRLAVYSFIARYKGPISTSQQKVQTTMKKYKLKTKQRAKASNEKVSLKKDNKTCADGFMNSEKKMSQKIQGRPMKRKEEVESNSLGPKKPKIQRNGNSENIVTKKKKNTSNGKCHKLILENTDDMIEMLYTEENDDTKDNKSEKIGKQQAEKINNDSSSDKQEQLLENYTKTNKENANKTKTQSESESQSVTDHTKINNVNAQCVPGPSQQTGKDVRVAQSGSETPSFIDGIGTSYQNRLTEDTIGSIVEPSEMYASSQESKHSLSQSTIADFLAAQSEDAIVPEMVGLSQHSSQHSLPFEE